MLSKTCTIKVQHIFLIIASLFFYGYFNIKYLFIIIASIIFNYSLALMIQYYKDNKARKVCFIIGILFNIGMLGYYKYYDFFVENINILFNADFTMKYILLPLGISFFTFQQFSFLLSVYKREEVVEGFFDYSLFVTFFPQLVAGPIVIYSEMIPQFKDEIRRYVNYNNIAKGIFIFAIGLFKKIVIADTVALFVNNGFNSNNDLSFAVAWVTSISYTIQIYFDFSGYSDMAIGIGKMLNIDLTINFKSPYLSKSIKEFWNRWHITLGRALSSYIYIPLGGNRKGKCRMYFNLLITFFASGLWHGAAWTFIVWGLLHGVGSIVERIFNKYINKLPDTVKIFNTFMFVNFTWVLFRATSWNNSFKVYKGMFNIKNMGFNQVGQLAIDGIIGFPNTLNLIYVVSILLASLYTIFRWNNTIEKSCKYEPTLKNSIYVAAILVISLIHLSRVSPFIYFNF